MNAIEWLQAQDLLLELVEVLTPFTERTVPFSFFLSRRFILPKSDQAKTPLQERRLVQLLTQLQVEVDRWACDARPMKLSHLIEDDSKEVPIARHAQRLIGQVREAIFKLCTSDQIQNRQEAPLRQALQAIKPGLDRMVQAVEGSIGAFDPDSLSEQEAPEKRSIAAAPFVPNMQKLILARRFKKKSSKAWAKEEEEESKA